MKPFTIDWWVDIHFVVTAKFIDASSFHEMNYWLEVEMWVRDRISKKFGGQQ